MGKRGRPPGSMGRNHVDIGDALDAARREFARRLTWASVRAGYANASALANATGLNVGGICRMFNAKAWPSMGSLYRIAKALDCSPGSLLPHWDYDERCYGCESDAEVCDDALCVQRGS